jgi:hypothetical protein
LTVYTNLEKVPKRKTKTLKSSQENRNDYFKALLRKHTETHFGTKIVCSFPRKDTSPKRKRYSGSEI